MIEVIQPGLFTTIQDKGRWGYQAYGMPVAGAMDRYAYTMSNILVGNRDGEAALEMTILGGTFRFNEGCWIAICGADMEAKVNGMPIDNWSAHFVPEGGLLELGYAGSGCRSYLAVAGGVDVPPVFGSRSTYTRAGIGGLEGRALRAGDRISACSCGLRRIVSSKLPAHLVPVYRESILVRVMLGPQDDHFASEGIDTFFGSVYTVTNEADRMGYRLEGPAVKHKAKADIVSDALCQGAIQVPGHGMPIVMMADRQTTGGYAKIGTVIGADLSCLAQAKPGDTVKFCRVSEQEAVEALRQETELYRQAAEWVRQKAAETIKDLLVKVDDQLYDVQIAEIGG